MSEDIIDKEEQNDENTPVAENQHSDYKPADTKNESVKHQLSGMYQNWFLDYASYVIWNVPFRTSMTDLSRFKGVFFTV